MNINFANAIVAALAGTQSDELIAEEIKSLVHAHEAANIKARKAHGEDAAPIRHNEAQIDQLVRRSLDGSSLSNIVHDAIVNEALRAANEYADSLLK